ncbi:hypothetical protein WBJ53_00585 [Spirosoma sp. SC4-14]|uniref:energy transducer TonB n=1 Tax=Spirosoma sp. SC4-14 TaxID=3128900 RepID=UPI0030D3628E
MKTIARCLLCLFSIGSFFSSTQVVAQSQNEKIYTVVEKQPEFPGGKAALSRYLAENIKFPSSLMRKNYNTGPVAARFIIGQDGVVRDVRISVKPIEDRKMEKGMKDFMKTIIDAIEQMPRWHPGEVHGAHVAVFYTLPIEVNMQ